MKSVDEQKEACDWENEFTGRRKLLSDWIVAQMAHRVESCYAGKDIWAATSSGIMDMKKAGRHTAFGLGTGREGTLCMHWSTEAIVLDIILSILDNEEVRNAAVQSTK